MSTERDSRIRELCEQTGGIRRKMKILGIVLMIISFSLFPIVNIIDDIKYRKKAESEKIK